MGGVTTEFGGGVSLVYHSEEDVVRLETALTAVVAWRRGRATDAGWRARFRRWQYRLGLGPLNRRFSIGRDAGHWYGSGGMKGEHATLFHPTRRVVRALENEYVLPPGMTLVLLIDETGKTPNVRVKQIPMLRISRTAAQLDPASGHARLDGHMQEIDAWRGVLRADPEIAEFIASADPVP